MDDSEFDAFVVARSGALLRYGRLVSAHRQDAEDLVQGALAAAFRHRRRLDGATVESYVRRSIVNAQATRWRRLLTRERLSAELPDAGSSSDPTDHVWALQVLRSLPPRQRAVLVLRYVLDLDEAAVAAELDVSRGTVKSQTSKALASLRARTPVHPQEADA